MGCCGQKTKRNGANQTRESLFVLPEQRHQSASSRMDICSQCGFLTWLTGEEYLVLMRSGMIHEIEELPEISEGLGRRMFCRRKKEWVPAMVNKSDPCPLNYWPDH